MPVDESIDGMRLRYISSGLSGFLVVEGGSTIVYAYIIINGVSCVAVVS